MKSKITLSLLLALTVTNLPNLLAETYIPYLPVKTDLAVSLNESDYSSFDPEGDYSLEVYASQNATVIVANNSFYGYKFIAPESGTYRFAKTGSSVNIYYNNSYLEKISLDVVSSGSDISFPEIFKDKDDAEAKTGIYSSLNLLRNPGFEDLAEGDDMVGVDTYIPAIWQCANFGLTGAKTLVFSYYDPGTWGAMAEEIEGKGALQHHGWSDGSGKYFFQKIESGLESDNIYSLSFLTWNHGDTFTGTYTAKFGYDENDDSIATITWSQPTDSAYQKKEHSYVFKTGDIDNSKPIYFTITRNENVIAHFDRMTLVKATSSSINPGLNVSGVSSVKFEDGTAYAPKVVLADGEIFDFSGYIVNPDMDDRDGRYAIGWSGTNRTNNGEQFDGATNSYYLDDWNGDANLEYDCYQKLTNLVNGIYRLEVCARANDDTFVIYATTKAGEFSVPIINHSNGVDEDLSTLGKGWNKHIINDIKVVDGNMTIGGKGVATKTSAWLSMDEFRLYYISAITESEVVVALAENLQKYIDEVPDIIYNMREYLPQRIQDYVTSVKEEAVKALNDGERTQETIQTAHDNLLAAVASAQEFYDITESINEIKTNIYSGMLEESPEAFTEPVGEALDAVNELLENDNRTLEELKLAYENLKAAYDRAYSAQGPYGALINAIDEIKYLISICENSVVKEELESLVESAITVLDAPDSKGDDYQSAVTSLYKYVITIFKGYESEDYTIELTNPGCHTEANDIVPDGWTIDKGAGNNYTNSGQHYTILQYETGSDGYNEAVSNKYLDSWNKTAGAMIYNAQSIFYPVSPGLHILKAAVRSDGTGAYIFAHNTQTEIIPFDTEGGELGNGWNYAEVPFVVGEDLVNREIVFGAKTVSGWTGTWFSADDFEVHHYPALTALLSVKDVETSDVSVYVVDGKVVVVGAEHYTIVSIDGRILSPESQLPAGIYYVVVNGRTYPVFAK